MEVTAIAKNIRVSPQKVRVVVNEIKKMQPSSAVKMLDFIHKGAAKPLKKVLMSAIANATNNNNLDEKSLTFKEIQVGHGLAFKRYRPISRGRVHDIKKRTSHIRVVLDGLEAKSKKPEEKKDQVAKDMNQKEAKDNGTKS